MRKIKMYELLFFISYFLFLVCNICQYVHFIRPFVMIITNIIPFLLLITFIIGVEKISFTSFLKILFMTVIIIISYLITKYSEILYTFLFIISAKNISVHNFIKKDFIIKVTLILFTILMFYLGVSDNVIMLRNDGTIRQSLGLSHPNRLGLCLFSCVADIFYLHYSKIKISDYLFLILSFIICTVVCDSRASQIGIIMIFLLSLFNEKLCKIRLYNFICLLLPFILVLASLFFSSSYDPSSNFWYNLDQLFSTRISCANEFLDYYGINLFGHFFQFYGMWDTRDYLTVLDNAYIHILVHYGILIFCIIMMCFNYLLKKAKNKKNHNIYIYILPFLFYGLMERHIVEIQYNCILIFISLYLYENKINKKNKLED